jgi:hypothetical protein
MLWFKLFISPSTQATFVISSKPCFIGARFILLNKLNPYALRLR